MPTETTPATASDVKKCLSFVTALLFGLEATIRVLPGGDMADIFAPMLGLGDNKRTYQILLKDSEPKLCRKVTLTNNTSGEVFEGYVTEDLSLIEAFGLARSMTDEQLADIEAKLKELLEGKGEGKGDDAED
jgi:hypothetical protein